MTKLAKVICFSCQKGGVGKTTSTHNIGFELASLGKKVLLVDLDPSANLTESFDFIREAFDNTVCNIFDDDLEDATAYQTGTVNLSLIPSTPKLGVMRTKLAEAYHREDKLNEGLEAFRPFYDYILIDTPPALDLLVINAYVASDYLIVPTEATRYSKVGMNDSIRFYHTCRAKGMNKDLKYLGLLVTRFREQEKKHKAILANLNEIDTVLGVINTSTDANEGSDDGMSAIEVRPSGVVGKAYSLATAKILDLIEEDENNG